MSIKQCGNYRAICDTCGIAIHSEDGQTPEQMEAMLIEKEHWLSWVGVSGRNHMCRACLGKDMIHTFVEQNKHMKLNPVQILNALLEHFTNAGWPAGIWSELTYDAKKAIRKLTQPEEA